MKRNYTLRAVITENFNRNIAQEVTLEGIDLDHSQKRFCSAVVALLGFSANAVVEIEERP